jgi:hypothetical protein
MFRKDKRGQRDHLSLIGAATILAGVIIIAGIVYTYVNRPSAVIEHVLNIRQIFEDHFR